ncbi:glutathione S-transferase family protein [Oligoflexus tunisiensis]|uniref:glutathione S-transferase family protein n=1 Tax=Oligoflexus tunisiensis TaxID=708132 RepID=UPI00114CF0EB|nr:glutathione S-transferase family protein [Oligoflexus tunisiensis]
MSAVPIAEKIEPAAPTDDGDIFAKTAPDIVLYQWPASQFCDSIYVRCTKIHRMLAYLHAPYKVADISFPKTVNESEISDKVKPLMRKIPIIKVNDTTYIEGTAKIVLWLLERNNRMDFVGSEVTTTPELWYLEHWAERWLVWLVIYGRWLKQDNYVSFVRSFMTIKTSNDIPRSVAYVRTRACDILRSTEVGGLRHSEYINELTQGAQMLNKILERTEFVTGPELKELDLSLFMSIQALLDPSLEEESQILNQYPALTRWAKKVDAITRSEHTREICIHPVPR